MHEDRVQVSKTQDMNPKPGSGVRGHAQTLYCGNVAGDQVVQVTRGGVRLAGAGGRGLLAEWRPPPGLQVNVASASATQVGAQPVQRRFSFFLRHAHSPVVAVSSLLHSTMKFRVAFCVVPLAAT